MTRIPTVVGVDGARVGRVSGWAALEFGIERARLPGRALTLFFAPPRAAVEEATYAEACALAQRLSAAKISRQSWNLVPRIEIDGPVHIPGRKLARLHYSMANQASLSLEDEPYGPRPQSEPTDLASCVGTRVPGW